MEGPKNCFDAQAQLRSLDLHLKRVIVFVGFDQVFMVLKREGLPIKDDRRLFNPFVEGRSFPLISEGLIN